MSKSKTTFNILDTEKLLNRLGASNPEVANLLYPKTYEIMMHPFTVMIEKELPELGQLLSDMSAKEMVHKLSYLSPEEKLIDLGLASAGKEASEKDGDGE